MWFRLKENVSSAVQHCCVYPNSAWFSLTKFKRVSANSGFGSVYCFEMYYNNLQSNIEICQMISFRDKKYVKPLIIKVKFYHIIIRTCKLTQTMSISGQYRSEQCITYVDHHQCHPLTPWVLDPCLWDTLDLSSSR